MKKQIIALCCAGILVQCASNTLPGNTTNKQRILLGCPVARNPQILKEYLSELTKLNQDDIIIDYLFIDDNNDKRSSKLLHSFAVENEQCTILPAPIRCSQYICNDKGHQWTEELIWRVATLKNTLINKAIEGNYDYLFLVDSDLILHPDTLTNLIGYQKDIIGEIYWTNTSAGKHIPQAWLHDDCKQFYKEIKEVPTGNEINRRTQTFFTQLRIPGIYPVGGFDSCMLISKKALLAGVNFDRISNISFKSCNVHFCLRAAALDFDLFIDTRYPAHHLYGDKDLETYVQSKRAQNENK